MSDILGLKDKDMLSKSDPVCVLFMERSIENRSQWEELGRTEQIKNSHNPQWLHKFVVDYRFEVNKLELKI